MKRLLKKIFYLIKVLPVAIILIFTNFTSFFIIRFFNMNKIIDHAKSKYLISIRYKIKIEHIIILQNFIQYLSPRKICFVSALSVYKIFKRLKYSPKLIIGITVVDNEFKSHAWIRINEKVFFDSPDHSYKKILEF